MALAALTGGFCCLMTDLRRRVRQRYHIQDDCDFCKGCCPVCLLTQLHAELNAN